MTVKSRNTIYITMGYICETIPADTLLNVIQVKKNKVLIQLSNELFCWCLISDLKAA